MNAVEIHPVGEQDISALLLMIQTAFEEHRGKLDPPSGVFKETVETLRDKWQHGGAFLARVNGHNAGGVLYEPEETYMYLGRLAVLPEFRGHGVARALVDAVEAQARALHLPTVRLGVRTQLPGNLRLFEHLGYRVIREESHPGHTEPTFLILEKSSG